MTDPIAKTVRKSLFIVIGMFGFGFALVPIYDVFCDITGLNGKTADTAYEAVDVQVDTDRTVLVRFMATNNENMPWEFRPTVTSIEVHPGQAVSTEFFARNPRAVPMMAQAVPSLVPFKAAQYFHKTECFCFNQQTLDGETEVMMPLQFIVDVDLPQEVKTITLAYTLFDVSENMEATAERASRATAEII